MSESIYDTLRWRLVADRARKRDGDRCTVGWLLGSRCSSGTPHVHHIDPLADGGAPFDLDNLATVCASHHPVWETLRRNIVGLRRRYEPRSAEVPKCRHYHRTAAAREECEAELARRAGLAPARPRENVAA